MLIDTHAHLDEDAFSGDFEKALARAQEAGVGVILTIGTTLESSRRAVELAERSPMVYAAVGIHPNYASTAGADDWDEIVKLAAHPRVKAIGETGLDRYWDHTPIEIQIDYFQRHIALSQQTGKPFIVHCRDAEPDVLAVLKDTLKGSGHHGVMHSFCGSPETANIILGMGMYLSFAGMITFRKNSDLREIAAKVPSDRILVETDSPYLAPTPHRGKRNEPAWVKLTAAQLAEARGVTLEEVAEQTTVNACRLFSFPVSS